MHALVLRHTHGIQLSYTHKSEQSYPQMDKSRSHLPTNGQDSFHMAHLHCFCSNTTESWFLSMAYLRHDVMG